MEMPEVWPDFDERRSGTADKVIGTRQSETGFAIEIRSFPAGNPYDLRLGPVLTHVLVTV